ncbi:MAG: DUF1735 domain-containing protein [Muribaculaceae bacterium]|nr:DUF1735 domain-containing protein [Muribaculaceae bacterium]
MKNKLYISLFAAAAVAFSACESDIDNFMVDDTVGLLNSGLVDAKVYTGVDDPTKVFAIKAGKGRQSADVSISVDPTVLEEYNTTASTKLKELPSDCYSISVSKLVLTTDDYRMPFEISWNRDRLEAALADDPNQVIPLRMSVTSIGTIDDERLTTLVRPVLEQPLVAFARYGLVKGDVNATRGGVAEQKVFFDITANFIAQRDINYTLEIDNSLIDEYNAENNTNYRPFPEGSIKMDLEGKINEFLSTSKFNLVFVRSVLVPDNAPSNFGNFMLPIRLKSLSSSNIDADKSVILYTVSVEANKLEKGKWSIVECNSDLNDDPNATESEKANNGADALIDGSTSKWWRSFYRYHAPDEKKPDPENDELYNKYCNLPYYAVVDFGRLTAVAKVGFEIPASSNKRYANSKAGHVELSLDGVNWVNVGTWSSPSAATQAVEFDVTPMTARYMKFVIEDVFKDMSTANKKSTGIGELNVWGEVATWEEASEE